MMFKFSEKDIWYASLGSVWYLLLIKPNLSNCPSPSPSFYKFIYLKAQNSETLNNMVRMIKFGGMKLTP